MSKVHASTTEERQEVWRQIQDARIGFLTTSTHDGHLRARPLTTQKIEDGKSLWFFIERNGDTAHAINAHSRVMLTYTDPSHEFYASLQGRATVIADPGIAREMWTKLADAWFPGGPEDPNLALLRVDVDAGETWEPTTNRLVQFMSIMGAALTHTPPNYEGEHKTFTV
jgi:general stress protein 26